MAELSQMDDVQPPGERAPRLIVITGPGGVGKSALALRWLDTVLEQVPHGALYSVLTESTGHPVAAEDVLGEFLRALGVPADAVPGTLRERATLFRSITARRSIAVMLDDAFSAGQVRTLLPASGSSVVVVTSRRPLVGLLPEGAVTVVTEPLDPVSATDLIKRHVGDARLAAEHAAGQALISRCEGLPLALAVAAALMVLRPRRSVAELVADLDNERRRLDVLSVDEDLSVRATFDVSYRSLPQHAARTYHAVGVHPGRLVSDELVAAACGMVVARAAEAIDTLVDAHMLDEVGRRLYRCHDLLRAHARAVAGRDAGEDTVSTERAVFEWHLFVAQQASRIVMPARPALDYTFSERYDLPPDVADHTGALGWLERHRLDLAAVVRAAVERGQYELAYQLADAMQPLFTLHKHNVEAIEVSQLALTAATRWGDWDAEANMRKVLARGFVRLGQLDEARQHTDHLLEAARQRGDQRTVASALKTRGRLHARRGEHEQAVLALDEATQIVRGFPRRRPVALSLIDLGWALIELRRLAEADDRLAEAMTLLGALDEPDPYNTARATRALARVRVLQGDAAGARRLLDDALGLLAAVGADDERAANHEDLAEIHDQLGDAEQAQRHRARATRLRTGDS